MYIIRAGLTGCLAAIVNSSAQIIEPEDKVHLHKAVLRFRTDAISKVTGIPFKQVTVTKSVYDTEKQEFCNWTPKLANLYSQKVIGGIYNRSIGNLNTEIRWLAPDNFHEQLLDRLKKKIQYNHPVSESFLRDRKFLKISTMPLPDVLKALDMSDYINLDMSYNHIYVNRFDIMGECDVNQTVYIPSPDTSVYRITLEGRKIIVESTEIVSLDDNLPYLVNSIFGTSMIQLTEANYPQRIGKIAPTNDEARKELIWKLTQEHNIYSLGRTAIWKNILLDDCLKDVYKINEMLNKSAYERAIG